MVLDHEHDHPSRWAAIKSIAAKIGCSGQSLLEWVKKAEVNSGKHADVPTELAGRLKARKRQNRELRQANEILRKASACFAQAALGSVLALSSGQRCAPAPRSSDDQLY